MLDKKQNVFDDFISAGEWLIKNNYTSTSKLAVMGYSNGGLLTAATMLQRPDLFGAVVCSVAVLDMLRYHKFTLGKYWICEYGNPEDENDFKYIYKYSPLHNVKNGVEYPTIYIDTADTDTRVVPHHSMKFTATLQEAQGSKENPVLLRIFTKAGHGHGKSTEQKIHEVSDIYSFLMKTLDMDL